MHYTVQTVKFHSPRQDYDWGRGRMKRDMLSHFSPVLSKMTPAGVRAPNREECRELRRENLNI